MASASPATLSAASLDDFTIIPSTNSAAVAAVSAFEFPYYSTFPPFYSIQPNLTTQSRQLQLWSDLILSYCAHYRLFRLSLSSLPADLFNNVVVKRSLSQIDVRKVLDWMSKAENGGRAEWLLSTAKHESSNVCYIYWRTPSEWADMIYNWVDETGQKGTILTMYELQESDAVQSKEWRDMGEDLLRKVLNVLVKRNKAQIFGQEETAGVKFF